MVNFFKLDQEARSPTRNKEFDAGLDLYSLESVFIPVGATKIIKTGVAIQIPVNMVGKIEDRSSLAAKGLRTGAGVIDHGYSGEVGVVLHNFSAATEREPALYQEGYNIKKGDKIAQLLIYPVETPAVKEVYLLWNNSERGSNGYGSSGR